VVSPQELERRIDLTDFVGSSRAGDQDREGKESKKTNVHRFILFGYLRVLAVLLHEEVGGSVDIEVGGHRQKLEPGYSIRLSTEFTPADLDCLHFAIVGTRVSVLRHFNAMSLAPNRPMKVSFSFGIGPPFDHDLNHGAARIEQNYPGRI
jgi:hypothetical protein